MIRPILLAALVLGGPALAGDREDIETRLTEFETALNGGDAAGVAALYTEDAMVLPPDGEIAEGREAIHALWQSLIDAGLGQIDLQPADIEVAGNVAAETSTFEGVVTSEEGETPVAGKYVVVWKRIDGVWFLHRDIWNTPTPE